MKDFGLAKIKAEGSLINLSGGVFIKNALETVYVERRVPKSMENITHKAIDKLLRKHGFDPEKI